MKLNVSRELKLPGHPSAAELSERFEDFAYQGREIRFASPVKVSVEYSFDGSGLPVRGKVTTAFHSTCARCGKAFIEPFEAEFHERFAKNADGEDEAYPYAGEELDFDDLLRDTILLNMPGYSLCAEDCRGLCPVCGRELNTAQCACVREQDEEETINPFLKLRSLLEDASHL